MSSNGHRPRVASGGILIIGGETAGLVARGLVASTTVGTIAGLDPDRRVATLEVGDRALEIAYAELVLALDQGALPPGLGLPVDEQGRVRVDETSRVIGAPHIWALGGCAAGSAEGDVIGLADRLARQLRGDGRTHG